MYATMCFPILGLEPETVLTACETLHQMSMDLHEAMQPENHKGSGTQDKFTLFSSVGQSTVFINS
jgi:hypothetical protein